MHEETTSLGSRFEDAATEEEARTTAFLAMVKTDEPAPVSWVVRLWRSLTFTQPPVFAIADRVAVGVDSQDRVTVKVTLYSGKVLRYAMTLGEAREHSGHVLKACVLAAQRRHRG